MCDGHQRIGSGMGIDQLGEACLIDAVLRDGRVDRQRDRPALLLDLLLFDPDRFAGLVPRLRCVCRRGRRRSIMWCRQSDSPPASPHPLVGR
ncbi:hypothetical protein NS365_05030 [Aureimonas ureilytica]|uniref:Uncharacterized protein n=1 Tax=Aureimonas ureilytica TaxID=401562 RepID=A0A175RTJ5_9HYPH|nr:hypothetical protein NS365_05030 [Aureimonas ureilytica]